MAVSFANPNSRQMSEELRVSEEFLAKYNRPGPRYTSYPTAPVWNDAFGPDELRRLEPSRDDGLVLLERGEIRTTWLGRIFIRNLAMIFDPYLERQQLAAKPLFSKTL
jgi:coproporphyrinogen III oxidase-like Fe-S oxidoreductase